MLKYAEMQKTALKGGRDTVIMVVTEQRDALHETEGLLWQGRPQKQNIRQPYIAGCRGMTGTCRKAPASRRRRRCWRGTRRRTGSADFTPFRNIINELYAKDTSKKVKSAKRARFLDGMYISTSAPYGYKKDPSDRHRLVIDERYAPTVRMIFSLAKDGMGILQIRNYINSRHILRPSAVNPNGYGRYFNGEDDPKRYEWSNNSVRGIDSEESGLCRTSCNGKAHKAVF